MNYTVAAMTDIGKKRATNQDSICVKRAIIADIPVVMAIVCDGMGGLADGELASATVVRGFDHWFENQFPDVAARIGLLDGVGETDWNELGRIWCRLLETASHRIKHYGEMRHESLGTTFSGMLITGNSYLIVHVGDTRVYRIEEEAVQLTTDHTVVNREMLAGRMTPEEAARSPMRSVLTQCVGASKDLEPEVRQGEVHSGDVYVICSDGFRHKISTEEMGLAFQTENLATVAIMEQTCREIADKVMARGEKDNISAVVIKAE